MSRLPPIPIGGSRTVPGDAFAQLCADRRVCRQILGLSKSEYKTALTYLTTVILGQGTYQAQAQVEPQSQPKQNLAPLDPEPWGYSNQLLDLEDVDRRYAPVGHSARILTGRPEPQNRLPGADSHEHLSQRRFFQSGPTHSVLNLPEHDSGPQRTPDTGALMGRTFDIRQGQPPAVGMDRLSVTCRGGPKWAPPQ